MTTQTIVLISIFVTVAIAAGVIIFRLVDTSSTQAEQQIATESIGYQSDCPAPGGAAEGFSKSLTTPVGAFGGAPAGAALTDNNTMIATLIGGIDESKHGVDLEL